MQGPEKVIEKVTPSPGSSKETGITAACCGSAYLASFDPIQHLQEEETASGSDSNRPTTDTVDNPTPETDNIAEP